MTFRPATAADEEFFYEWRRIAEIDARSEGWWNGRNTEPAPHHRWFLERLRTSTLLVWMEEGIDAGIARIESNGEVQFETAPRTEQALLEEIRAYVSLYDGRLKITIDADDPKQKAIEAAGFREYPARAYTYRP